MSAVQASKQATERALLAQVLSKAEKLIANTRYEKPTVIAFPLSGVGQAGQVSMVGNGGEVPR